MENIIEKLEESGVTIHEYKEEGKLCGYELDTHTSTGINQIIFIDFRDTDKDPTNENDFIELFKEWVNEFDTEEEIKILIQDNRFMKEVGIRVGLKDLDEWKERMIKLF